MKNAALNNAAFSVFWRDLSGFGLAQVIKESG